MNEPIYFEINLDMLRRHMECARGHNVSPDEFERTLNYAGFTRMGTNWYCDRTRMTALDDSEIRRQC